MLPKRLKSGLLPLLIGGLVLLLPLLAALQYHWLGQLSQAEREHLQAHLHADAEHFSEDFDREMLRAALYVSSGAATCRNAIGRRVATGVSGWLAALGDKCSLPEAGARRIHS